MTPEVITSMVLFSQPLLGSGFSIVSVMVLSRELDLFLMANPSILTHWVGLPGLQFFSVISFPITWHSETVSLLPEVFYILTFEFDIIADARSCQKAVLQITVSCSTLYHGFVAISIQIMHCHLIKMYIFYWRRHMASWLWNCGLSMLFLVTCV